MVHQVLKPIPLHQATLQALRQCIPLLQATHLLQVTHRLKVLQVTHLLQAIPKLKELQATHLLQAIPKLKELLATLQLRALLHSNMKVARAKLVTSSRRRSPMNRRQRRKCEG